MDRKKQKYIMHLDGDAFFVAVEVAKDPRLRGRPVVTGQERGIASAMSYEAKRLGITRAMPIFQIRREFPQVAVVSSDYESYAVFSRRMFDIVRRYTDRVEEYSIDECFADFSDIDDFSDKAPEVMARIKGDIKRELGISVSLGMGPTKVLAKAASKMGKPDGLTILPAEKVPEALAKTPVDKIWGIGFATSFALRKLGISTALELAKKDLAWVEERFSKPLAEMWHELNCVSIHEVKTEYEQQRSIMKTRTFGPASRDGAYVFSELSKNIEHACRKARELGLVAREFSVYLKTSGFTYRRHWCRLAVPTNNSFEIIAEAKKLFEIIFSDRVLYRATGVTLYGLLPDTLKQESLFEPAAGKSGKEKVLRVVDRVNKRYGRNVIHMASSARAFRREDAGETTAPLMPRGFWRKLAVPYLGEVF